MWGPECDGLGMIHCICGGDFCLCGMHGEPCDGCEKCDPETYDPNYEPPEDDWERDELADYEFEDRARRDAGEY